MGWLVAGWCLFIIGMEVLPRDLVLEGLPFVIFVGDIIDILRGDGLFPFMMLHSFRIL